MGGTLFVIQSYICFIPAIVDRERTIEFAGAPESSAKTPGHFFVIDIMAKTTCWPLMTIWLGGRGRTPQRNDRGEDVSFEQQTPVNYSRVEKTEGMLT